jgi:transcriptional regulator with XRE-family HTH domain
MSIDPSLDPSSAPSEKRETARWPIRLEVAGALGEQPADVTVHDISTAGMLIETRSKLKLGQVVLVTLPEAGTVAARVVWQDDPLFGCRFDEALPQAAVSATRLRSSMRSDGRPVDHVAQGDGPEMLPQRLRRLRRERGLSRAALSERTGFSKPSLWAWESGKTMPRRKSLLILADVFGLTEQQLLLGEVLAAPRNSRPADAGQQLHEVIDAAKRQIAQHAGVDKSQVHIRIDY